MAGFNTYNSGESRAVRRLVGSARRMHSVIKGDAWLEKLLAPKKKRKKRKKAIVKKSLATLPTAIRQGSRVIDF